MHAVYSFLLDYELPGPTDWREWAEAEYRARYADRFYDESNYHQALALVFPGGSVFEMCSEDDGRGRQRLQETLLNLDRRSRWSWAIYSTTARIAHVLGACNYDSEENAAVAAGRVPGAAEHDRLLQRTHRVATRYLAEAYSSIDPPPTPLSPTDKEFWYREIVRWKRGRIYETFRISFLNGRPPFAEPELPRYTAFDLRRTTHGTDITRSVILLVDIHT